MKAAAEKFDLAMNTFAAAAALKFLASGANPAAKDTVITIAGGAQGVAMAGD